MKATVRILTVDNEPSVSLSLRYVFGDPHYEVTGVASGEAALSRLDANFDLYDIIIVDEQMPNLTGVELVTAIRQRGINGKVIVVSAHLTPAIREAYERLGVQMMFGKPFNVEELRSTVDRLAGD
jgi:DNA-binding response OmpR family regulator